MSLQEFVEVLVDWASALLQSFVRQTFQTTTGKLKRKRIPITIFLNRSNVDCEWRIEGPTGHYLSFNFQQVFDKTSYLSTFETPFLAVWPSPILQLFLRRLRASKYPTKVLDTVKYQITWHYHRSYYQTTTLYITFTRLSKRTWQSQYSQLCAGRLQSPLWTPLAAVPGVTQPPPPPSYPYQLYHQSSKPSIPL